MQEKDTLKIIYHTMVFFYLDESQWKDEFDEDIIDCYRVTTFPYRKGDELTFNGILYEIIKISGNFNCHEKDENGDCFPFHDIDVIVKKI